MHIRLPALRAPPALRASNTIQAYINNVIMTCINNATTTILDTQHTLVILV